VNGELVGNVHASERVQLSGKARVFGDLESPIIVLEEGVMFEGRCRMPKREASDPGRDASVVPLKRS
jgi:cytoskeletal protein CcmA (bactofilin family)